FPVIRAKGWFHGAGIVSPGAQSQRLHANWMRSGKHLSCESKANASKKQAMRDGAVILCNTDAGKLAAPLTIGGVTLRNRVFLAPMSGVTDVPFRRRAYAHGAGLAVSEMVASGELAKG